MTHAFLAAWLWTSPPVPQQINIALFANHGRTIARIDAAGNCFASDDDSEPRRGNYCWLIFNDFRERGWMCPGRTGE